MPSLNETHSVHVNIGIVYMLTPLRVNIDLFKLCPNIKVDQGHIKIKVLSKPSMSDPSSHNLNKTFIAVDTSTFNVYFKFRQMVLYLMWCYAQFVFIVNVWL